MASFTSRCNGLSARRYPPSRRRDRRHSEGAPRHGHLCSRPRRVERRPRLSQSPAAAARRRARGLLPEPDGDRGTGTSHRPERQPHHPHSRCRERRAVRGSRRHHAAWVLLRRARRHRHARSHRRAGGAPRLPRRLRSRRRRHRGYAGRSRGEPRDHARCRLARAATTAGIRRTRRGGLADRAAHAAPLGCFTEPVHLAQPLERFPFTRTYIKATAENPDAPGSDAFWSAAAMAKASPAWRYREIATTHMVASNRPADLARVLLERE